MTTDNPNDENNDYMLIRKKPAFITLCEHHGETLEAHGKIMEKQNAALVRIEKKIDEYLLGTADKKGIVTRVNSLEDFKGIIIRCVWISVSVGITTGIGLVIYRLIGAK